jgi:hypothetical protein
MKKTLTLLLLIPLVALGQTVTNVPDSRTISTTAPLTGGGNLTANLTLAISSAATNAVGAVQLATDAEIQTGTDTAKAVRSSGLAAWWTWVKTQAQTFAGNFSVNGNATLGDASGDTATINAGTIAAPNGGGSAETALINRSEIRTLMRGSIGGRIRQINLGTDGWASTVTGSGARSTTVPIIDLITGATTGSTSFVRNNVTGTCNVFARYGEVYNRWNMSRPTYVAFLISLGATDSNVTVWINIGDLYNDATIGDLVADGIGIKISNTGLRLQAYGSATLTTSASDVATLVSGANLENMLVELYADGAGNLSAWINGAAVTGISGVGVSSSKNNAAISVGIQNGAGTANARVTIPWMTLDLP